MNKRNKQNDEQLPDFLSLFLWSYDLAKLNKAVDKKIIIKNILDFGTVQATGWLRDNYTIEEIKKIFRSLIFLVGVKNL